MYLIKKDIILSPSLQEWDIGNLMDKCGYYADVDAVQRFITKFGADAVINARRPPDSCLHEAAWWGKPEGPEVIVLLKENGADLEPKQYRGKTPLRLAIEEQHYNCITTLVQLGASLDKANESKYDRSKFEWSMNDEKTKAAIQEGQRLAAG